MKRNLNVGCVFVNSRAELALLVAQRAGAAPAGRAQCSH